MSTTAAPIVWSDSFALFHARRLVAELRRVLASATQEYVVLMRHEDLFYVYRRQELAAVLEGKDPNTSVEKALDMREDDRSRPTDPAGAPSPSPVADIVRPSPVGRYVHLGPGGMPVRVGDPAETQGTGPVRGAPPSRGRPRMRGAPQPGTQGGGTLGGASRRSPTAETRGGGPQATPPVPAEDTDEGTDVVRHPSITPDKAPKSGEWFSITVDLLRERADPDTQGTEMRVTELPKDWGEIPIRVKLMSTDLVCSPENGGMIFVRRNASSLACTFSCKLKQDLGEREAIEVAATFEYEGRFCGIASRRINTEQGEVAARARATAVAAAPASASFTRGRVSIEPGALPPDLTVKILHPELSAPGYFAWSLTPRERFEGLPGKLDGSIQLESSAQEYARDLFGRLAELEPGDHMAEFEGVGERLWEKAPASFREAYWAMRDRYGAHFSIQFISDDPYIPWELMRPIRVGEDTNLLVVDHPVARWINQYDGDMRNKLPSGRIVTIAPKYLGNDALPEAQGEAKQLERDFQAMRVDGTKDAVTRVLQEGLTGEAVAVIHFAGHGEYGLKFADASRIQLADGKTLSVNEVGNADVKLGEKHRTLVIFNACEVGAVGPVLGMVGGWAEAFTRRKFGGFVAPLWPVADDDAATVISELLDAVWKKRQPVGDALRAIREKHGDRSPTFFSYLFYGDVMAQVTDAA